MSNSEDVETDQTCDYCGERPDPSLPRLLGTYGGPQDPFDWLCIRHWRAFERGNISLDPSGEPDPEPEGSI